MELLITKGLNQQCYNLPTTNKVAMINANKYQRASYRDIMLAQHNKTIERSMFRNHCF